MADYEWYWKKNELKHDDWLGEIGGYCCPCPLNSGVFLDKTCISKKEDVRQKKSVIFYVGYIF
jgi:hypothetical protein